MGTYKKIQAYVKSKYGFIPKPCWIADAKEKCGLSMRKAWNRTGEERKNPCSNEKLAALRDSFAFFGILK